jgi:hypothetical protein
MVITVILINMSGNWIASKLDWLMMACALASANPLLAVRPRLATANPTSPPQSLHATPAPAYVNDRRQVGEAGSAAYPDQQRGPA